MTEPTPGQPDVAANLACALSGSLDAMPIELLLSGCFGGGPLGALDGVVPLLVPAEQELLRRNFGDRVKEPGSFDGTSDTGEE